MYAPTVQSTLTCGSVYVCVCVCVHSHVLGGWQCLCAAHVLMLSFPQISHSSLFSVVYGYVTTITREKGGRNKVSVKD